jgi:hypothetical protein
MQRHNQDLKGEMGQTAVLFGTVVALVLAVVMAGLGL